VSRRRLFGRVGLVPVMLAYAFLALASGNACLAAEPSEEESSDTKRWELELFPYVWIPGNFGTLEARGRTAQVDVSVKDSLDLATAGNAFTGSGFFELRYDRLFTYVDGFGGYVDEHVTATRPFPRFPRLGTVGVDAKLKLKPAFIDFGLGYRLGEWSLPKRRRPMTLGIFAGVRYNYFFSRMRAAGSVALTFPRRSREIHGAIDVSKTFDWADPLVGVKWEVPLLDCLSFEFRGDIGGFEAGSDIAWNLVSGLRYWPSMTIFSAHPWIGAGYRALGVEYPAGSDGEVDLQFRGPYGGLGLVF